MYPYGCLLLNSSSDEGRKNRTNPFGGSQYNFCFFLLFMFTPVAQRIDIHYAAVVSIININNGALSVVLVGANYTTGRIGYCYYIALKIGDVIVHRTVIIKGVGSAGLIVGISKACTVIIRYCGRSFKCIIGIIYTISICICSALFVSECFFGLTILLTGTFPRTYRLALSI